MRGNDDIHIGISIPADEIIFVVIAVVDGSDGGVRIADQMLVSSRGPGSKMKAVTAVRYQSTICHATFILRIASWYSQYLFSSQDPHPLYELRKRG